MSNGPFIMGIICLFLSSWNQILIIRWLIRTLLAKMKIFIEHIRFDELRQACDSHTSNVFSISSVIVNELKQKQKIGNLQTICFVCWLAGRCLLLSFVFRLVFFFLWLDSYSEEKRLWNDASCCSPSRTRLFSRKWKKKNGTIPPNCVISSPASII